MQYSSPQESEPPPLDTLPAIEARSSTIAESAVYPAQFTPDVLEALEELAEGGSIADALRDAIALSKWFKDVYESGANVFIERNGKFRKVVKIR